MPVTRHELVANEDGTTLVELMVGMAIGMVVLSALTVVIVVSLRSSARVSARVEATQRARVVLTRIMEELHSACVAPQIAPVREKSTGTSLGFVHATGAEGAAVAPKPTLSVISLEHGVLSQSDYPSTGGTSPTWSFAETGTTRQLLTDVGPVSPSSSIFSYYQYVNGTPSETPLGTPLSAESAAVTVEVHVAFTADPTSTPVADAGADASVQDSAALRLTPPSFNEGATALPCQ
jgi:hypothetical protein